MPDPREDAAFWTRRLQQGERLAWVGRPRFGVKLDRTALAFSGPAGSAALGILFGGKGLLERVLTGPMGMDMLELPELEWQLRLAAVATLVYLAGYLFAYCVVSPRFTMYALTDRRALVRQSFPWPRIRAKRLTPSTPVDWDGLSPGTIVFDAYERDYGVKPKSRLGTAATVKTAQVAFEKIEDAAHVHDLMKEVAQGPLPA